MLYIHNSYLVTGVLAHFIDNGPEIKEWMKDDSYVIMYSA
jgi:hypothetical protein